MLSHRRMRKDRREKICYFAFRGRRRKTKSIHLRWVGLLKAVSCPIIAYCGLLQPVSYIWYSRKKAPRLNTLCCLFQRI